MTVVAVTGIVLRVGCTLGTSGVGGVVVMRITRHRYCHTNVFSLTDGRKCCKMRGKWTERPKPRPIMYSIIVGGRGGSKRIKAMNI